MSTYSTDRKIVITSADEFYPLVGLVHDYREVLWLDLEPKSVIGAFPPEDIEILLAFCRSNPEFHIVTSTNPWRMENRYVSDGLMYRLARGNPNPNLIFNALLAENHALIDEEVICTALAVIDEIKDDRLL